MSKKHILVVSQYFYPEPFRINDMCCEWVKRGYKVTVITGIPNYPEGKFYKDYNWFKNRKETWNGVEIMRIPLIARGKSSVGMVLNYFSFVCSGFFWSAFTKIKADIVFTFEVSPMTQALLGVWYSKRRQIPHYLYVQDLWPENVEIVTGIRSPVVIRPIEKMVEYIYKKTTKIFATSPSFVKEIEKRIPDEPSKVFYWPQYAEEFYRPLPKQVVSDIPDDNRFKLIFTGNIGQAQGLDVLPKAALELKKQNIDNISFVIVGDGRYREQLETDIKKNGVEDMFVMIGRQPAERIPELLASCDMAFVSFMDNQLFSNTIPAKLQSYMACGMPIVAAATGETRRVIEEANCGVCSPIGDGAALAENLIVMSKCSLSDMSQASRSYFESHFEKQMLMDEMDQYINSENK